MKKLNEGLAKLAAEIGDVLKYRLIAEVVEPENCIAGHTTTCRENSAAANR